MLKWEIDDVLERFAARGEQRITPAAVARELGTPEVLAITEYLFSLAGEKVAAQYEVECPFGHSDFVVSDPSKIPTDPVYCRLCEDEEPYVPDPNRVWVTFRFIPEFVEHAKKKYPSHRGTPVPPVRTTRPLHPSFR